MILVTGASGTNGREVLRVLRERGVKARALVRNTEKAGDLGGAEMVKGDLADRGSLERAMVGVESVFALAPVHRDAVAWFENLFAASLSAGVRHVVKFSGMGADAPTSELMRQHGISDRQLMESGLSYTILRPNSFYQNLLGSAETIKTQGKFYLPMGDARQSCEDVRDIAEVAAKALTDPATHAGKIYTITGPAAMTYPEIAETLSRVLGKPVEYVAVPREAAEQGMMAAGMPEWSARAVAELMQAFASAPYAEVTGDMERVLGRKPRGFEEFVRDNAAAFR